MLNIFSYACWTSSPGFLCKGCTSWISLNILCWAHPREQAAGHCIHGGCQEEFPGAGETSRIHSSKSVGRFCFAHMMFSLHCTEPLWPIARPFLKPFEFFFLRPSRVLYGKLQAFVGLWETHFWFKKSSSINPTAEAANHCSCSQASATCRDNTSTSLSLATRWTCPESVESD